MRESKAKGGGDEQEQRVGVKEMLAERNAHKVEESGFRHRHRKKTTSKSKADKQEAEEEVITVTLPRCCVSVGTRFPGV